MKQKATFLTQELESLREKAQVEGQPGRFAEAMLTLKQALSLEKK
jgi:hypothetical protein